MMQPTILKSYIGREESWKLCMYVPATLVCPRNQKLKLISQTVRVNLTALFVFKLRNHSDQLDGIIREYSALDDAKALLAISQAAAERPNGFLYISLLAKSIDDMFFSSFVSMFQVSA